MRSEKLSYTLFMLIGMSKSSEAFMDKLAWMLHIDICLEQCAFFILLNPMNTQIVFFAGVDVIRVGI